MTGVVMGSLALVEVALVEVALAALATSWMHSLVAVAPRVAQDQECAKDKMR
jgi:hypothetical protein